MAQEQPNPDAFTAPFQLTKGMHRDMYGPMDPKNPDLNAAGKVVIITGAAGGLGFVRCEPSPRRFLGILT